MVKYNITQVFEQEVFFEVEAKNKKEALKMFEENPNYFERDWLRGSAIDEPIIKRSE